VPFPWTDLSYALRERRSEGGEAVQDCGLIWSSATCLSKSRDMTCAP